MITNSPPPACPFEADLKALLDGELPPSRRDEVERHVTGCAACTELTAHLRVLTQEVRAMSDPISCPDSVTDRVLNALPVQAPSRLPLFGFSLLRWAAAGGLATVMGAILFALLGPVISTARKDARPAASMASRSPAEEAPYWSTPPPAAMRESAKGLSAPASSPAMAPASPPGGASAGGGGMAGPPTGAAPMASSNGMPAADTEDGAVKASTRERNPARSTDDVNRYARGNAMDEVIRKVVKSAQMTVEVNERLETLQDAISRKVTADEGYVESLNLTSPTAGKRTSQMALRVPVDRFESTIEYLGKFGQVTSKTLGGKDITGTWLEDRKSVRDLRAQEAKLAEAFRNAPNRAERERVRQRMLRLRPELKSVEEQFAATAKLAALASIALTLVESPQAKVRGDLGRDLENTTREACSAFLSTLRIPATLMIWLAIFTPLWLPCLMVYRWATRMARRQLPVVEPIEGA